MTKNCRGHASADRQSPPWTNFLLPASLTSVFQEPGTENKMRAHAPPSDRRNRAGRRKGTPLPNTRSARPRGHRPLPGRLTPQRPAQLPAWPGARVWQALSQPRLSGVGVFPGRTPGCCRVVPWGTGVPTPSRPWGSSLTPLQTPVCTRGKVSVLCTSKSPSPAQCSGPGRPSVGPEATDPHVRCLTVRPRPFTSCQERQNP